MINALLSLIYPQYLRYIKLIQRRITLKIPFAISTLSASLLLLSTPVLANTPTALPELVVTATRTPVTANDNSASVSVITRQDIENRQAADLPTLLSGLAGVSLVQNGGSGQIASLFVRGANSNHVLVLIDGVRLASATAGATALQNLPLHVIERIELVRGPRSALYGAEAVGGVLQIFTRQGSKKSRINLNAGFGTEGQAFLNGHVSGQSGKTRYALGVGTRQTDGFNACRGSLNFQGCFTEEFDDDGYSENSLNLNLSHEISENVEIGASVLRSEANTEFDSSFQNESDAVQQALSVYADMAISDTWDSHLQISESRDELESFGHEFNSTVFDTRRRHISWQNDFYLREDDVLSVGYDYAEENVSGTTAYTVDQRQNHGVFAQYQGVQGAWDWVLGGRYEDNEQFGNETTGQASVAYRFNADLRAFISYGTAFHAPTFNELYFPGFGNPLLQPEKSNTVEIGLSGMINQQSWTFNVYQSQVEDLISAEFDPASGSFLAKNVKEADILGAELSLKGNLAGWDWSSQFTWLQARDGDTDKHLARRPELSAAMDVSRGWGNWRVGGHWKMSGHGFDNASNSTRLDGYGVLDMRLAYRINTQWTVKASVNNVFDKTYETAAFFPMPERNALFSVHYQGKGL
jgi:vitamin B12 transporter